jgi:hypothetical protein
MSRSSRAALVSACLAALAVTATAAERAAKTASEAAFERLTSLVGEWEGAQQGVAIKVTYTLTADGSALMEEMRPAGSATMVTMFSVDGDRLLATHYCSAGNQPQMATEPIRETEAKPLAFSLLRVTGLKTPDTYHNTGLVVTLEDADHVTQKWSYLDHGKDGTSVFRYTRRAR